MEVHRRPFDPSNLPWAVSQCPFDPYRAGAKVYRAYRAGGRAARPTDNPDLVTVSCLQPQDSFTMNNAHTNLDHSLEDSYVEV
jgi:hypothetical protein